MQNLLNRLYSYGVSVDEKMVGYALTEIVAESTYAYEHLLNAYSRSIGRLLKAIAMEGCVKEIQSGGFIGKYHLKAASSVNTMLRKMLDNELVYKTSDGYIVYDRFMGEWLRRQAF